MGIITDIFYLLSVSLFILGIKKLGSPKTAQSGNTLAGSGMLIAIVITLLDKRILDFTFILAGLVIGTFIGIVMAKKVKMTDMPQMVAILNAFGGGASALVAFSQYIRDPENTATFVLITVVLSLFIGTITFSGSVIAFAKLQGIMAGRPIVFIGQKPINLLIIILILSLAVASVLNPSLVYIMLLIILLSAIIGVLGIIPIGGADMPVVISLLNSFSGLAAAATGFVLGNNMLIIAGTLVGASGIILTNIMCRAMNRSIFNVFFSAVGAESTKATSADKRQQVTSYTPEDAAMMLESSQTVIVVPGYGLAVAQAQHVLHEMAALLNERDIQVRYAIHPVAGRMPGHMNVLLAEANVSYDQLFEMESINDDFQHTDVVLVVGANDVTNPAARTNKDSALYGMPILNVDQAKSVIIVKRSLSVGFAGEDNPLFYEPKTMMVFGDAKDMLTELVKILKE